MWLNNPQCGHREGPIFWCNNNQGYSNHIYMHIFFLIWKTKKGSTLLNVLAISTLCTNHRAKKKVPSYAIFFVANGIKFYTILMLKNKLS